MTAEFATSLQYNIKQTYLNHVIISYNVLEPNMYSDVRYNNFYADLLFRYDIAIDILILFGTFKSDWVGGCYLLQV